MHKLMDSLARGMALLGGAVLLAIVLMLCVSIIGQSLRTLAFMDWVKDSVPWFSDWIRSNGIRQIRGDFEVAEAGVAFAVFAFLPICQLRSGHATVDIFTHPLGRGTNLWLRAFWDAVLALVLCLIAWRLAIGTTEKFHNGQMTFVMQFPLWWAYGASLVAAIVGAIVALWTAAVRFRGAMSGDDPLPEEAMS